MSLSTQHPLPPQSDRLPTDSELVVQARAGDPLAFEKLFERYNERVCLYLTHMVGNDAVGCELAQETFLKAWQALPGFRDEARFVNWLYRIATNLAHDHQRHARLIRWLPWERIQERGSVELMSIAGPEEHVAEIDSSGSNDLIPAGGVLVDYTTFANVYASDFKSSGNTIPMNYAWLRTRSDPASLASVRHAISQGELQLTELYDRRATFDALHREPLYLDLIGVLALGATTALLLALVGNLLASWLSARGRRTTFAVLRALGTTPRELASVLTWEQALIYTTSIVLGVLFGAILSALIVPALVFSSVAPSGTSSDPSSGTFFVSQSVPPIQIIIPSSLGLALAVLIAICLFALGMMIRVVSQPSISQTLRLNED